MMNSKSWQVALTYLTALCLLGSAYAHAFLGWPSFKQQLIDFGVSSHVIGAINAGWYFGSLCMLAFAALSLWHARYGGQQIALRFAAVVYLIFGIGGFLLREFNTHYLAFVLCGVLMAVSSITRK